MLIRPHRKRLWKSPNKLGLCLIVTVWFALIGSTCNKSSGGTGAYIASFDQIGKVVPSSQDFSYLLDGTPVKVKFIKKTTPGHEMLEIVAYDKVLEREGYMIEGNQITLFEALSEEYWPPIPLMVFPFNVGDSWRDSDAWTWKGNMTTDGESIDCEAQVQTSPDQVRTKDKSIPAIQVDVNLKFKQSGQKVERKLSFWFVQNEGVLKREFGTSVRTLER